MQLAIGAVILPLASELDILDSLEMRIHLTDSLGQHQMRMIERKPVSTALGLCLEHPLDQRVGVHDRQEPTRLLREGLLPDGGFKRPDQPGVLVHLRFELFGAIAQLGTNTLCAEPFANDVVFRTQKVLADVSEKVKVADDRYIRRGSACRP